MARGRSKCASQAEKVLAILLPGNTVTLEEINATLKSEIFDYKLPTYLWELKAHGAEIERLRTGRKVTGLKLLNAPKMAEYYKSRFPDAKVPTPAIA